MTKTNNYMDNVFVRDLNSGKTTLVSVNKDGNGPGNGSSDMPVISADGRFVAFCSTADDLVTTDTNTSSDVFVRDLQNETTTLVSVNKDGADSGNSDSDEAEISANGQIVAFKSYADDLVNTDTNGITDVFVFEVQGAPHG